MADVKTIAFDVDGVVARETGPYADRTPYPEAIRCIRLLKQAGYRIVYFTARGMSRFNEDQEKAREAHEQELVDWLARHDIPNDGVFLGKPHCCLFVDNNALRLVSDYGSGEWTRLMSFLGSEDLNKIAVGDVVELKSGGPPMTVVGFAGEQVLVTYFSEDGELLEADFPAGSVSVTERRWEGFTQDEVARAAAEDEDDEDDD